MVLEFNTVRRKTGFIEVQSLNLRMMYFLRGCLTWMMTEIMSRMTTRPQVTPIMVRLVLSSVSRMLCFLFSGYGNTTERNV